MDTAIKAPFLRTKPTRKQLSAKVSVPGSKSLTQRAMVAAALCEGTSTIASPLISEDTTLLRNALCATGAVFEESKDGWRVRGTGGRLKPGPMELYLGNNGTGIRFMTSVAALGRGRYVLTGTRRMEERPIEPLLHALRSWGVEARCVKDTGCPPVELNTNGLSGGRARLSARISSQFLSSLLLAAPCAASRAEILLEGEPVSRPYVALTLAVMRDFGVDVLVKNGCYSIPNKGYSPATYNVEGDASGASYFWAAAAVTGGRVLVSNIPPRPLQGDAAFPDILAEMGCGVERTREGTAVTGPGDKGLNSLEISMASWPDVVPTLAVVAAFARGKTIIRDVAHLRVKETDRLKAVASELTRMGAGVEELDDGLIIHGGRPLHGAKIRTYEDHRMAMAFAVAGLMVPDVIIEDPDCVRKSFPDFWSRWRNMLEQ